MAKATGFQHDNETGDIIMNAGDTGSFKVHCSRASGDSWPETARMLYTIRDQQGEIVLQRIYRLDDQWDLGDGVVLIEFHNDDTDEWDPGQYNTELRFDIDPIWEGTAPTSRCANALTANARMVEGSIVRTKIQSTLTITGVQGMI